MGTSKSPDTIRKVPVSTEDEDENEDEKEEIHMPAPPADWAFNDLLVNIANEMTTEDLDDAKARFKGDDGFGRRLLSEIENPLQFFDSLQKHMFLSRNNLLFLQAMLFKIGRMDLYEMAIDYAQRLGDVIYFCTPPTEPANGYRYIQFHIEGKDFTNVKRSSLEAIRMTAARLMIVPPEFVVIAGIEPSSSLLITIMVPERFVKYFEAALTKEPAVQELTNLGIDIVRIDDKVINIHGIEEADIIETEEQTKLKTIYDQLQRSKGKLEDRDIECLQLKKRLDIEHNQKTRIAIENNTMASFINMLWANENNQKVPKLSKQSAFVFFKHVLHLVKQRNYDKDIIALLLDAQAAIISVRVRDSQFIQQKILLFENQRLRDNLFQFQIANARLQILNAIEGPDFQKRFSESLKALVGGQRIGVSRVVNIEFNPVIFQILKEISGMLRDVDRKILINDYLWSETDDLTKQLKNDPSALLAILVAKETVKKGCEIPFVEFINAKLTDVKREDLRIIFNGMMTKYSSKSEYTYAAPAAGGSPLAAGGSSQQETTYRRQQSKPSKRQNKHGKKHFGRNTPVFFRPSQQQSKRAEQPAVNKQAQEDVLIDLLKKVNKIEGMLEASHAEYKSTAFGTDIVPQNLLFKQDPRNIFARYASAVMPDL